SPNCICRGFFAALIDAPFSTSTCGVGRLKLVRLVKLKDSQRNCNAFDSENRNRRDSPALRLNVPGPSRMFRPELRRSEMPRPEPPEMPCGRTTGPASDSAKRHSRYDRAAPPRLW